MNEEKKKEREKEPPQEAPSKEEAVKKPPDNKPLFLGILIGVIILNTLVAFLLIQMTRPKRAEEVDAKLHADSLKQAEIASKIGTIFPEQPIEVIVNIAGTDGERFLKTAVQLEIEGGEEKKGGGGEGEGEKKGSEIDKWVPKIRNIILEHLSKLTLMEVNEPEAKEKIRKDLLRLLNNALPPKLGEIRDVFFIQFLIQ